MVEKNLQISQNPESRVEREARERQERLDNPPYRGLVPIGYRAARLPNGEVLFEATDGSGRYYIR